MSRINEIYHKIKYHAVVCLGVLFGCVTVYSAGTITGNQTSSGTQNIANSTKASPDITNLKKLIDQNYSTSIATLLKSMLPTAAPGIIETLTNINSNNCTASESVCAYLQRNQPKVTSAFMQILSMPAGGLSQSNMQQLATLVLDRVQNGKPFMGLIAAVTQLGYLQQSYPTVVNYIINNPNQLDYINQLIQEVSINAKQTYIGEINQALKTINNPGAVTLINNILPSLSLMSVEILQAILTGNCVPGQGVQCDLLPDSSVAPVLPALFLSNLQIIQSYTSKLNSSSVLGLVNMLLTAQNNGGNATNSIQNFEIIASFIGGQSAADLVLAFQSQSNILELITKNLNTYMSDNKGLPVSGFLVDLLKQLPPKNVVSLLTNLVAPTSCPNQTYSCFNIQSNAQRIQAALLTLNSMKNQLSSSQMLQLAKWVSSQASTNGSVNSFLQALQSLTTKIPADVAFKVFMNNKNSGSLGIILNNTPQLYYAVNNFINTSKSSLSATQIQKFQEIIYGVRANSVSVIENDLSSLYTQLQNFDKFPAAVDSIKPILKSAAINAALKNMNSTLMTSKVSNYSLGLHKLAQQVSLPNSDVDNMQMPGFVTVSTPSYWNGLSKTIVAPDHPSIAGSGKAGLSATPPTYTKNISHQAYMKEFTQWFISNASNQLQSAILWAYGAKASNMTSDISSSQLVGAQSVPYLGGKPTSLKNLLKVFLTSVTVYNGDTEIPWSWYRTNALSNRLNYYNTKVYNENIQKDYVKLFLNLKAYQNFHKNTFYSDYYRTTQNLDFSVNGQPATWNTMIKSLMVALSKDPSASSNIDSIVGVSNLHFNITSPNLTKSASERSSNWLNQVLSSKSTIGTAFYRAQFSASPVVKAGAPALQKAIYEYAIKNIGNQNVGNVIAGYANALQQLTIATRPDNVTSQQWNNIINQQITALVNNPASSVNFPSASTFSSAIQAINSLPAYLMPYKSTIETAFYSKIALAPTAIANANTVATNFISALNAFKQLPNFGNPLSLLFFTNMLEHPNVAPAAQVVVNNFIKTGIFAGAGLPKYQLPTVPNAELYRNLVDSIHKYFLTNLNNPNLAQAATSISQGFQYIVSNASSGQSGSSPVLQMPAYKALLTYAINNPYSLNGISNGILQLNDLLDANLSIKRMSLGFDIQPFLNDISKGYIRLIENNAQDSNVYELASSYALSFWNLDFNMLDPTGNNSNLLKAAFELISTQPASAQIIISNLTKISANNSLLINIADSFFGKGLIDQKLKTQIVGSVTTYFQQNYSNSEVVSVTKSYANLMEYINTNLSTLQSLFKQNNSSDTATLQPTLEKLLSTVSAHPGQASDMLLALKQVVGDKNTVSKGIIVSYLENNISKPNLSANIANINSSLTLIEKLKQATSDFPAPGNYPKAIIPAPSKSDQAEVLTLSEVNKIPWNQYLDNLQQQLKINPSQVYSDLNVISLLREKNIFSKINITAALSTTDENNLIQAIWNYARKNANSNNLPTTIETFRENITKYFGLIKGSYSDFGQSGSTAQDEIKPVFSTNWMNQNGTPNGISEASIVKTLAANPANSTAILQSYANIPTYASSINSFATNNAVLAGLGVAVKDSTQKVNSASTNAKNTLMSAITQYIANNGSSPNLNSNLNGFNNALKSIESAASSPSGQYMQSLDGGIYWKEFVSKMFMNLEANPASGPAIASTFNSMLQQYSAIKFYTNKLEYESLNNVTQAVINLRKYYLNKSNNINVQMNINTINSYLSGISQQSKNTYYPVNFVKQLKTLKRVWNLSNQMGGGGFFSKSENMSLFFRLHPSFGVSTQETVALSVAKYGRNLYTPPSIAVPLMKLLSNNMTNPNAEEVINNYMSSISQADKIIAGNPILDDSTAAAIWNILAQNNADFNSTRFFVTLQSTMTAINKFVSINHKKIALNALADFINQNASSKYMNSLMPAFTKLIQFMAEPENETNSNLWASFKMASQLIANNNVTSNVINAFTLLLKDQAKNKYLPDVIQQLANSDVTTQNLTSFNIDTINQLLSNGRIDPAGIVLSSQMNLNQSLLKAYLDFSNATQILSANKNSPEYQTYINTINSNKRYLNNILSYLYKPNVQAKVDHYLNVGHTSDVINVLNAVVLAQLTTNYAKSINAVNGNAYFSMSDVNTLFSKLMTSLKPPTVSKLDGYINLLKNPALDIPSTSSAALEQMRNQVVYNQYLTIINNKLSTYDSNSESCTSTSNSTFCKLTAEQTAIANCMSSSSSSADCSPNTLATTYKLPAPNTLKLEKPFGNNELNNAKLITIFNQDPLKAYNNLVLPNAPNLTTAQKEIIKWAIMNKKINATQFGELLTGLQTYSEAKQDAGNDPNALFSSLENNATNAATDHALLLNLAAEYQAQQQGTTLSQEFAASSSSTAFLNKYLFSTYNPFNLVNYTIKGGSNSNYYSKAIVSFDEDNLSYTSVLVASELTQSQEGEITGSASMQQFVKQAITPLYECETSNKLKEFACQAGREFKAIGDGIKHMFSGSKWYDFLLDAVVGVATVASAVYFFPADVAAFAAEAATTIGTVATLGAAYVTVQAAVDTFAGGANTKVAKNINTALGFVGFIIPELGLAEMGANMAEACAGSGTGTASCIADNAKGFVTMVKSSFSSSNLTIFQHIMSSAESLMMIGGALYGISSLSVTKFGNIDSAAFRTAGYFKDVSLEINAELTKNDAVSSLDSDDAINVMLRIDSIKEQIYSLLAKISDAKGSLAYEKITSELFSARETLKEANDAILNSQAVKSPDFQIKLIKAKFSTDVLAINKLNAELTDATADAQANPSTQATKKINLLESAQEALKQSVARDYDEFEQLTQQQQIQILSQGTQWPQIIEGLHSFSAGESVNIDASPDSGASVETQTLKNIPARLTEIELQIAEYKKGRLGSVQNSDAIAELRKEAKQLQGILKDKLVKGTLKENVASKFNSVRNMFDKLVHSSEKQTVTASPDDIDSVLSPHKSNDDAGPSLTDNEVKAQDDDPEKQRPLELAPSVKPDNS